LASGANRDRRVDDRTVSGAAAQIAGQRLVDGGSIWPGFGPQGEQGHDETGRTEAALRGVVIDHCLLHRVQRPISGGEVLDGQQLTAVQGREEQDAGVDGLMAAILIHEYNCTRAAVAFRAAFLGAAQTFRTAQIFQHGHGRVDVTERSRFGSEAEVDRVAHRILSPWRRCDFERFLWAHFVALAKGGIGDRVNGETVEEPGQSHLEAAVTNHQTAGSTPRSVPVGAAIISFTFSSRSTRRTLEGREGPPRGVAALQHRDLTTQIIRRAIEVPIAMSGVKLGPDVWKGLMPHASLCV
jgi:hypothetical protein